MVINMKKGLIVVNNKYGNASENVNYKISRFKEEFIKFDYELEVKKNDGSIAMIDDGQIKINIENYDFIIYLDKDKYLARILQKAGFLLINNADFIELCDDKMLTHIRLANLGYKMPKTISGPLVFQEKDVLDRDVMENVKKHISYPLLIKGVYGSLGMNMMYVNNDEEFLYAYKKMKSQPLIFQEYITSSYGRSIRCLVCDKKLVGAFERYNPIDYRSNYHEGASSKPISLNQKYIDFVKKIIDELNIDYAGVDLLFGDNDEPILCEINSNSFFKEFEKVTKINVAYLFAEMVIKKVNHLKQKCGKI